MWTRLALVLVLLAPAVTAAAQVKVTTLAEGDAPVTATTGIRLSRFADLSETNLLRVGDVLADGDLLTALDPAVLLELTCPRGSLLHFGSGFRVLIQAPEAADCAAAFLAGDLDVLTDTDTTVGLGGRTLGTAGTRYAVELHGGADASQWVWVFDGKVEVAARGRAATVDHGQMAVYRGRRPRPEEQPISAGEAQRWAGRYADFDLIKAKAAGVELLLQQAAGTCEKLAGLYTSVLVRPDDKQARVDLALAQIDNRIGAEAIHNLKRAGVANQRTLDRLEISPDALRQGDPQAREGVERVIRDRNLVYRRDLTHGATPAPTPP